MADLYGLGNTLLSAGTFGLNNLFADWQAGRTAQRNYQYGERAAQNADARTRALYNDFYSPKALLKQYKEAGLSPSIMYGGTPGQGGMTGAQGSGAGISGVPFAPLSLVDAAQAAALNAQTEKTKAETENISLDTTRQEIQRGIEELQASQYKNEWLLLNSTWIDDKTGEKTSIFEAARNFYTYEDFINWCRNGQTTDEEIKRATQTETGQKILREIYTGSNRFTRDIMVLSEETVSRSFQLSILNKLKEQGFIELNATAAIQQLKTSISTDELTQSQKDAWNNLLDRLGKKGSTGRDIAIILGMILSNFAGKVGVKINTGI